MVSPVSNPGLNALQRAPQAKNVNQTANRQVAQAVLNRTPAAGNGASDKTITLASANAQPQSNLPRGSIVDKLV
jgi:hypothetical protein